MAASWYGQNLLWKLNCQGEKKVLTPRLPSWHGQCQNWRGGGGEKKKYQCKSFSYNPFRLPPLLRWAEKQGAKQFLARGPGKSCSEEEEEEEARVAKNGLPSPHAFDIVLPTLLPFCVRYVLHPFAFAHSCAVFFSWRSRF